MPTIKGFEKKKDFCFFFTSHDREKEPHIHVEGSRGILKDLSVEYSRGLTYVAEERKILEVVEENQHYFLKEWRKFLKKNNFCYP